MPGSREDALTDVVHRVRSLMTGRVRRMPGSVLDVGFGFGKFGFLFREYLDLCYVGWDRSKWCHRIDGVEFFEPYIRPWHREIYDTIYCGEYLSLLRQKQIEQTYDVAYLGDVIEHWTRRDAVDVLRLTLEQARRVIVSTPVKKKDQQAKLGNIREKHLDFWTRKELDGLRGVLGCEADVRQVGALWIAELWKA